MFGKVALVSALVSAVSAGSFTLEVLFTVQV
jgi:hypothetical protein